MAASQSSWRTRHPAIPWVAPFAVFMALLVLSPMLPVPQPWESVGRVTILTLTLAVCSRDVLRDLRVSHPVSSVVLGLATCALWVAPDLLVPGWRSSVLFQNSLTGTLSPSIAPEALADPLVATLRVVRAALLVPVLEELFWRGWLPRWLVDTRWERVALGSYTRFAFVATAVLFALEHGPYWEVGLACGLLYNWWMWRTRSLGDLVLVHAVTNAALAAFVLVTRRYEYWM